VTAHVVYDAILGSGNNLKQVQSSNYRGGLQPVVGRASGAADPVFYAVGRTDPSCSFQSQDVGGALGILSISAGLYVSAGTITIPYHLRANGGVFGSGSVNYTLSGTNALIVPTSIEASQDQPGVAISIDCHFLSTDGVTAPVAANVNQALASQSFNALWGFGPVYFGGSQIVDAIGWTVNPGITVVMKTQDGGVFPTQAYITLRQPTIDIKFRDLDTANSVVGAISGSMTTAAVYAMQRTAGGEFALSSSTVHLKFSFGAGMTGMETISANGVEDATAAVRLYGETLTASAASTIP
jgi:hypothetical protein